ncbi:MAG: FAD-dependent monooxygenase [Betaproteobacteria bacterium]
MHSPNLEPQRSSYFKYQVHPFRRPPEMDGAGTTHPVVIVGAGPIGMVHALDLCRQGVKPVLIEAEAQVCGGSRALVLTRRSMEIIEQVGVADAFLAGALPWDKGRSFYRGHVVHELKIPGSVDDRFAPMTSQPQNIMEQRLVDAALRAGVDIRWQTRVTGLEAREDGVTLGLDTPEGAYELRCDWLVASDGARSTIRQLQGLRYEGRSYAGRFVIIDFNIELDAKIARRCYFDPPWLPDLSGLCQKSPYGVWRLDYQVPDDISDEEALDDQRLRSHVQAHLDYIGVDLPWEIEWATLYKPNTLSLARYNHGRVLYCGDAAHLLPVFGVRGMNTGLQDANNLAWKLAGVVKGYAAPAILDSYSDERVADAMQICFNAARSTRLMAPPTRGYRVMRDAILQLSVSQDFTRPLLHWRTSAPIDYIQSPLTTVIDRDAGFADGPRPGAPARNICLDPSAADKRWLFDAFAPGFQVIVFDAEAAHLEAISADVTTLRAREVPIRIISVNRDDRRHPGADVCLCDPLGRVHAGWAAAPGTVYVLRPDEHVAARWHAGSGPGVLAAVQRALAKAPATTAAAATAATTAQAGAIAVPA